MARWIKRIGGWLNCITGCHDWTSALEENGGEVPEHLKPFPRDSSDMIMRKFKACSRMYCRRCQKVSEASW